MRRYALRDDDQLYFLHIPKTGGMSLANTIYEYFPGDERPQYLIKDLLDPPERLRKQRFIVGHTYFTMRHFLDREPLYLTMLRDPMAQVVSLFRHIQRIKEHRLHDVFRDATLLDFLNSDVGKAHTTNFQTLSIAIDDDPRVLANAGLTMDGMGAKLEQLAMERVNHDPEPLLELVKARLQDFAFVGITERFADSVYLLNYTFHWEPSPQILHFNFDPQRPTEIPEEARAIITERTQLDAQLYQFGLELFEQRRRDMIFDLLETDHAFRVPDMTEESRVHSAPVVNLPQASQPYTKDNRGWSDGWVGPRWVLSGMALPSSMKVLEVSGKVISHHFKTPLKLTVLVGGKPVQQVEVGRRNKFSLKIPLTGATVEVLADQYFIPAQAGKSEDHRPLSWLIETMNLK